MNTAIEKKFLKAFEFGGIVDNCIQYISWKYDLGYTSHGNSELPKEMVSYYNEILPNKIIEETNKIDAEVMYYMDNKILESIESNLRKCSTIQDQDRYIFSLLKPFKRYSDIFCPIAEIARLEKHIDKWDINDQWKKDLDRTYYRNKRYIEIICSQVNEKDTVEYCFEMLVGLASSFVNRLDALLLTYRIDLMRLQNESGIYLKSHRVITDVDFYIGSRELAQKYIDELPKGKDETSKETPKDKPKELPVELQTDKAKALFDKAIVARYIIKDYDLYRWNGKHTKQLLAYFCEKASLHLNLSKQTDKDGRETTNWKVFEKLFEVDNIKSAKYDRKKIYLNFTPNGYENIDKLFD